MSIENKKGYEKDWQFTKRGKVVGAIAGLAATAAGVTAYANAERPDFEGHQIVVVDKGDTVDGIIKVHVEHGASYTGTVRSEVMNDPDNADVFENGQLDPGEELEVPEKAVE